MATERPHTVTVRLTDSEYAQLRRVDADTDAARVRWLLAERAERATQGQTADADAIAHAVADLVAARVGEDVAGEVHTVGRQVAEIRRYLSQMHHYLARGGGGGNDPRK